MPPFVLSPSGDAKPGVVCRVSSEQTKDAYTVLELVLLPGAGAPSHVHQREDEVFFVAAGACEIEHGGQTHTASEGAVVVLPKGQRHAFRNATESPVRILITAIPGGLDRYFAEIGALGSEATAEQIAAINRRYDIDFSAPG